MKKRLSNLIDVWDKKLGRLITVWVPRTPEERKAVEALLPVPKKRSTTNET